MKGIFIKDEENENKQKILAVKPQGKGPLRNCTPLWEDNTVACGSFVGQRLRNKQIYNSRY
jgi:hypothetical protein